MWSDYVCSSLVRYTKVMDDAFLKDLLGKERSRSADLIRLLEDLESAPLEKKEPIVRDIGNKSLHSCGGPTGITGLPLILDVCFPFEVSDKMALHLVDVHRKPEEIGTSAAELFELGRTITRAHLAMTYRIYIAYQIDLAAKGYTGTEADDLAFYLSRKETYFPWYKTPNTGLRKFITVFDIFDVSAEDIGLSSDDIHQDLVRFFQIWLKYLPRRAWDSLIRHIISDRWEDHGHIGMIANRLPPAEIDPEIAGGLNPDGSPQNKEVGQMITKKFGTIFNGNRLARLATEESASEDDIRKRHLAFIRHKGRLNPKPSATFAALTWGA